MTWQDRYIQASFRGVPFFTQVARTRAGQRRAIYEIPFDDRGVASIDLGRKPRKHSIEAVLLGEDYDADWKRLLDALEAKGPGLLVHPLLGTTMVVPSEEVESEITTRGGGMVVVRFEATESRGTAPSPVSAPTLPKTSVKAKFGSLKEANAAAFASTVTLKGVSGFVRDAHVAAIEQVLENLSLLNGGISAVLAVPGQFASEIDAISIQLANIIDTPSRVYAAIEGAVEKIIAAISRVAGKFGDDVELDASTAFPDPLVLAYRGLLMAAKTDPVADVPPAGTRDTPMRAIERANAAVVRTSMRALMLGAVANTALDITLLSSSDARNVRDALLANAEDLAADEGLDATVFESIEDLRALIWKGLTSTQLPDVTTTTIGDEMPADVLAWQLYGDAERGDEIVARNNLPDAGAVPGFTELEVLAK